MGDGSRRLACCRGDGAERLKVVHLVAIEEPSALRRGRRGTVRRRRRSRAGTRPARAWSGRLRRRITTLENTQLRTMSWPIGSMWSAASRHRDVQRKPDGFHFLLMMAASLAMECA